MKKQIKIELNYLTKDNFEKTEYFNNEEDLIEFIKGDITSIAADKIISILDEANKEYDVIINVKLQKRG